ncbi:MAG: hypothetical protein KAR87_01255 [Candidatus Aenigmarchaeota archaeon]|nr:hypothetical protein [Candidatus Aenigmarchaeota archaeon]
MGENRYNLKFKKKSGDFKNSNKKSFNSGFKPANKKNALNTTTTKRNLNQKKKKRIYHNT